MNLSKNSAGQSIRSLDTEELSQISGGTGSAYPVTWILIGTSPQFLHQLDMMGWDRGPVES